MGKSIHPLFHGIVLSAQQLGTAANAALLHEDAKKLTQASYQTGAFPKAVGKGISGQVVIANTWLKYRKTHPLDTLNVEEILSGSNPESEIAIRLARLENSTVLEDDKFVEMLTGAQVGLKSYLPNIQQSILDHDLELIDKASHKLISLYKKNAVPTEAMPLLLMNELIFFRSRNPEKSLSIFTEPRYGYLEIYTTPTSAQIVVDDEDWGLSPEARGVLKGQHRVKASKDNLHADHDVRVEPAKSKRMDLVLIQ